MDKIIIFGVNMFSSVVYQSILKDGKGEVIAFTLNKQYIKTDSFEMLPVIPYEELSSRFDMSQIKIAVTVGYSDMNKNRETVYNMCKASGYSIYTYISDKALVYSNKIGEGSILLPASFIGPHVTIGKCSIIWNQVCIPHHSTVGDFTHIAGGTTVGGGANIGSYCFIGMNSSIKNGINIGDNTFIGANSYMSESTDGGLGFYGSPAKNPRGVSSEIMMQFLQ